MAFDAHANLAVSTVATAPSPASSGLTLSVGTGEGARFPAAPFNCTVWPAGTLPTPANAEIIRVTSKGAGDNWTIVRETEVVGTARSILVGDYIAATITKKTLTDIEAGTNFPLLTSAGLVDLSGAAAGQIKFPATQNPSANANTLDDYEEGTFTPTIGGSGGQSGQTYTIQQGVYQKVGKRVHADITIALSALGTITGNAQITGLPFASENITNQNASASFSYFSGLTTSVVWLGGLMAPNVSVIQLFLLAAAGTGATAMVQANLSNASAFVLSISYTVAN